MYEINIALNGQHYFATADRSIISRDKAFQIMRELQTIYTKEKGFSMSLSELVKGSKKIELPQDIAANNFVKQRVSTAHYYGQE